jgi:DNA-binding transcriptional LysR family regulator
MALPNLTVQQLEYLVAAIEADTWAQAARVVGVTPSALSQGLAELERRVGVPLFERDGRRKVLAAGAAPVVDHARSVLAGTRELSRWAERRRSGRGGVLRVGMIDAAAIHHFPTELRLFRDERPDVEVRLAVGPSGDLLEQLRRGDLDVAVCVEPPAPIDDVSWSALRTEPLAVYAPSGVSTSGDPSTWGPWVAFPPGAHTRRVVADRLADLGNRYEVVAESHQPEVLSEMVRLGLGWTVLPVSQAESGDRPLDRARPQPLATRTLVFARRRTAVDDPAADALLSLLQP